MTIFTTLVEALRAQPADDLATVLSILVEPTWPTATALLERAARCGSTERYDVRLGDGGPLDVTPRPRGPRRVEAEPPIRMAAWEAPEPIRLTISGGDLWAQVLAVVNSGLLGPAEAAEHVVTDPDGTRRIFYVIVGRGRAGSPERARWLAAGA